MKTKKGNETKEEKRISEKCNRVQWYRLWICSMCF